MAEQFSASAAFTNNTADGWGDDWGDWNEHTAAAPITADPVQPKSLPMANSVAPNQYFHQQQPQQNHLGNQYRDGGTGFDLHNQNYLPNYNAPSPGYSVAGSTGYQHQAAAPSPQQQPPYGGTVNNNFYNAPPTHTPQHLQAPNPQRGPTHPAASTTPQLVPTFSQTISDSFDTSAANSWNWAGADTSNRATPSTGPPPGTQVQRLKAETLSPQWSIESQVSSSDRSMEGEHREHTQSTTFRSASTNLAVEEPSAPQSLALENLENPRSSSQAQRPGSGNSSYSNIQPTPPRASSAAPAATSSAPDRLDEVLQALSLKQDANDPNANFESGFREQAFPPPPPSIAGNSNGSNGGSLVNESLHNVSKATTPPLPPPPVESQPTGVAAPPPKPPAAVRAAPPKLNQGPSSGAVNPFKRAGPRSHIATPGLGGSGLPSAVPPNAFFPQQHQPAPVPQPVLHIDGDHSVDSSVPENQEILSEPPILRASPKRGEPELEVVQPSNDRNQYLQTGHLSEDGYNGMATETAAESAPDTNDGRLPPPGLSRYVPGQHQQPAAVVSFPEPPPGLDRMIPGTDLPANDSGFSLERQADGGEEVSDPSGPVGSAGSASSHLLHHHHHHHHNAGGNRERVDMSDRNLYRVPGEDDHHQQQRVVPGLENERSTAVGGGSGPLPPVPQAPPMQVPTTAPVPTVAREEQRELVMDGANPDDRREEPLEGGNGGSGSEGVGSGPTGSVTVEPDASRSEAHEASRHVEPSNTSTGEESDKAIGGGGAGGGNSGFYSKGRREEDTVRRSNKSKSSRDRYDTEDSEYSDRERRRRERETGVAGGSGGGGAGSGVAALSNQQRGERLRARGGERDKDKRKDVGHDRERDRDRDRDRDYDYRDRERNRYERSDRDRYGRSNKYDRDSRYETDGSKYETERSSARYDKDDTKQQRYGSRDPRDDYYRKRGDDRAGGPGDDGRGHRGADRAESDRRLRKDKAERSDRYRGGEERRKDDRYREAVGDKRRDRHDRRYPDPEDYRAGSRNGTERDRVRERDDRKEKDRKYLAGASGAGGYGAPGGGGSAYGPSGGYYDPYSYYAQHQQYYEQLRRTNPQAYAEWYRTYYAQMQASQMQRDLLTSDGRESVHSGRSSTNDKERFNRTTPFMHGTGLYNPEEYHRHFNNQSLPSAHVAAAGGAAASGHLSLLDQSYNMGEVAGQPSSLPPMFHQQAYQQHHPAQLHQQTFQQQQQQQRASTSLALNRTYHGETGGSYFQPRIDQIDASAIKSEHTAELSVMEPERLTPRKFPEIHPIVSLSAGLLISTKNRLTVNGMADTVKIFTLGYSDASRKLLHAYPGPLVKGVTHKKSVIEFCEDQLRLGPPYSGALALIKSRGNSINSLHSSSLAAGVNRSSFALLWNYIILLLRQNGTFVGTDISELLMQNKEEYPFESIHTSAARSANISGRNSSLSVAELREADARQEGAASDAGEDSPTTVDARELVATEVPPKTLSELEITDKFRSYLIYGNISEALEWATEHNLWGHALFLASKVDSRQHANVMMKFANKLTLNDPLQTLYQLLSGRTPASVTSVLDEKWGDWRPHLAMLMSNSSAKPELIKKSITTLGDTLFHRGDLYAAHFCYLLSDVAFGRFADVKHDVGGGGIGVGFNNANAVRLVLLGASHYQRNFRELSTNESIMMTEIYEYARSLNEDRYSITELQRYKYLLACRMLDQGMQLKCLLYMEQIADQIQHDPYRFETEFIRKVYTLGDRLKYYDPVMEKALDESVDNTGRGNVYAAVEDPDWLKRLQEIILSNSNSPSASATNYNGNAQEAAYEYGNHYGYGAEQPTTNSGYAETQEAPAYAAATAVDATDINKQFNEINHQLGQLNLQYNDQQQYQQQQQQQQTAPGTMSSYDQGYESINPPSMMEPTYDEASQQQQQHQLQSQDNNGYEQQQFNQHYNYEQHQQQLQQPGDGTMFTPAPISGPDPSAPTSYDGAYWGAAGNSEQQQPARTVPPQHNSWHHHEEEPEPEEEDEDEDHPQQQQQQQHRRMSDRSSSSPSPLNVRNGPTPHSDQFQTGRGGEVHLRQQQHASETVFDYHQHGAAALEASAPKPTISMPNSVSNRSGFNDEADDERPGGGQGQRGTTGPGTGGAKPGQPNHNASQTKQMPPPKGAKTGAGAGAQGSGWFGGIWNKFSMKPKNQMILPDDKNPKIVWDEVSKRWVNTDENEVETEAYKPPPKMADLIPSAAAPPGPTAPQPSGPMMPTQNSGPTTFQPMAPNTIGTANVQNPTAAPVTVQPNPAPVGAGEPTKVPTLQSNMYKMQRNRTLKRSYVDVFNPSGAAPSRPTEPVLAPSVPTLPSAQGGFFVPGGSEAGGQQSNDASEGGMPQFYNPNQFAGGGGYQQRQ